MRKIAVAIRRAALRVAWKLHKRRVIHDSFEPARDHLLSAAEWSVSHPTIRKSE